MTGQEILQKLHEEMNDFLLRLDKRMDYMYERNFHKTLPTIVSSLKASMKELAIVPEGFTDTAQICTDLRITRSTLRNWKETDLKKYRLLNAFERAIGNKHYFHKDGLFMAMNENLELFPVLRTRVRDNISSIASVLKIDTPDEFRFLSIKGKVLGFHYIKQEDASFYTSQTKIRREYNYLKDYDDYSGSIE